MTGQTLHCILTAPQVRQLSGVLLRKHLRSHWRRLPAAAHKQIQTALQQRLVQEPVEPVRRAVAELIASIARSVISVEYRIGYRDCRLRHNLLAGILPLGCRDMHMAHWHTTMLPVCLHSAAGWFTCIGTC